MDRAALATYLKTKVQLQQQLEREYLTTGIKAFDAIAGGVPRGAITEVYGPSSSGKTTFLHALVANAAAGGEFCALIDGSVSAETVVAASPHPAIRHVGGLVESAEYLAGAVKPGDVVIILGAGDSYRIGELLLAQLRDRQSALQGGAKRKPV